MALNHSISHIDLLELDLAVIFDLDAQIEVVIQEALVAEVLSEIGSQSVLHSKSVSELVLGVEMGIPICIKLALVAEVFAVDTFVANGEFPVVVLVEVLVGLESDLAVVSGV
jgi:hypothetical protein